ncbi:MAG TPA: CBS domain-containing protein [Burkholderiaceae bacterium]
MTQVCEVMTRDVRTLAPTETLMKAAQTMDELDVGVIPVCDGDRLLGVVTDRDIVVRGVAAGCMVDQATLREVMSEPAHWCYDDDAVEDAARTMGEHQLRRVPVIDHDRRLVGIVALADLATRGQAMSAGDALEAVSQGTAPASSPAAR